MRSTPRSPDDLAGSLGFMGIGADGRRWLMITLYGDQGWTTLEDAEDRQLITLGHELRHALEVADDPSVTSLEAFALFYRTIGEEWRKDRVDTEDARLAGRQVAHELSAGPSEGRVAPRKSIALVRGAPFLREVGPSGRPVHHGPRLIACRDTRFVSLGVHPATARRRSVHAV